MRSSHSRWSALVLVCLLGLCGCGSGYHFTLTLTTARFYSVDLTHHTLLQFTPDLSGTAQQTAAVGLPIDLTVTVVATDKAGNVYVGGYTTDVNWTEILEYPANLKGPATRSMLLERGKLTALAIGGDGQIYAAQLNVYASLSVYAASSRGASTPVRVINPTYLRYINDIAVDSKGNAYLTVWNGGVYLVDEFAPDANGPGAATLRRLYAPANSYFGGIAVSDAGDVYVMEKLTIVHLAPGTTGTPNPVNAINLPIAPYTAEAYSDVLRRDADGNFFAAMVMTNNVHQRNLVWAFASSGTGDAKPILEFEPKDSTLSATPLNTNIALAVF